MDTIQVQKRDGSSEAWQFDKLVASIGKAGVPPDASERIARQVEEWAKANAQGGVVTSVEIRDKVIENLRSEFPAEADNYQAYKKSSE